MLDAIRAATMTVRDMQAMERAYSEHLNYRVIDRGTVSEDVAAVWGAPAVAGRPTITMAPSATDERCFLRFIENPEAPRIRAHQTYGWNVTEINAGKITEISERLKGTVFTEVGAPKPLGMNPNISAMQVTGTEGELVYLTQINPADNTSHLPQIAEGIGRIFIMVLGVNTLDEAYAFYRDKLGCEMTDPFTFPIDLIADAVGVPADTPFRIALVRLPGKFTLEIDELLDYAKPRDVSEGDIAPGIDGVSFLVDDFDEHALDFLAEPRTLSGPVYDGTRVAAIKGPAGERLELIEKPA